MSGNTWLAFFVTEVVLCLTPGPAVLLVISQGLARGGRASIWSNLGILSGNLFYYVISATGLGAIILAWHELFFAIKWLGAAYLIWLGISAFRGKSAALSVQPAGQRKASSLRIFSNGFVLQAANPKALLFFSALLPQFIDPSAGIIYQVAILAVTGIVVEFFVLLAYGCFAGRMTQLVSQPRYATVANRISGSLLIATGAGVAAIRRT